MSHPILQMLVPIADGIAKTFGDNCEVAIHDLTHPNHAIFYVANGELMDRKKNDNLDSTFMELVRLASHHQDRLINYYHFENGHSFKCTKVLIRDENQKAIGCFCINVVIDDYLKSKQTMDRLCHTESLDKIKLEDATQSESENIVSDLVKDIIINTYEDYYKSRGALTKADKIDFARYLNLKGIFQVKGAVEMVAELLQVSKYTVYRYVGENHSAQTSNKG
ncbi:MAG: transcriptional regulator [Anaerotruncus sp.]|nr:transcriptional regulator [Anaerotruncus sp.]